MCSTTPHATIRAPAIENNERAVGHHQRLPKSSAPTGRPRVLCGTTDKTMKRVLAAPRERRLRLPGAAIRGQPRRGRARGGGGEGALDGRHDHCQAAAAIWRGWPATRAPCATCAVWTPTGPILCTPGPACWAAARRRRPADAVSKDGGTHKFKARVTSPRRSQDSQEALARAHVGDHLPLDVRADAS